MRRALRVSLLTVCSGVLLLGVAVHCTPLPREVRQPPRSTRVTARDGTLLHEALSSANTRGGPLPLTSISPHLVNATLASEDHRFFQHLGVDPLSLLRATWLNLRAGRVAYGGSTITQQLARLAFPGPRTLTQKLREAWWALVIEAHLTKAEILEQYLARAPYGGLLVGAEAAARAYFGKPALQLSLAEASLLAALPRAPDRYDLRKGEGQALRRRDHILDLMVARGMITSVDAELARAEPLARGNHGSPMRAPHAVRWILSRTPSDQGEVRTTLDPALQERAETLVAQLVEEMRERGATQAAALVVEVPTGRIRAYVGSADFLDAENHGQVDGTRARRSPGSALKPLIYGAALDRDATPATLLTDLAVPQAAEHGQYLPRNFDEQEHGPVLLRSALANSYNLAAVDLASRLGANTLLDILRRFRMEPPDVAPAELGLGVMLGGVDVRMQDLAAAYLALARGGSWVPLTMTSSADPAGIPVLSPQAAYLLADILGDDVARSPSFGRHGALHLPFAASVKTGTSKDFRDNWAVGFTTRYLVATWAGDFAGRPMRGVSGVTGAGTLWHRLMRAVHAEEEPPPRARPGGLTEVEICALSGALPGRACPHRRHELFRQGTAPRSLCAFHTPGGVVLPAPFQRWAEQVGLSDCSHSDELRVLHPHDGAVFRIDRDRPLAGRGLTLAVSGPADQLVELRLDSQPLGRQRGGLRVVWTPVAGTHRVEAVAGDQTVSAAFTVQ
ncbi:MAG: penicillin-binding protein 1C [Myxococcota bacterium]